MMLTLAAGFAERRVGVDLVLVKAEGEYLNMVPRGRPGGGPGLVRRTLTAVPRFLRYVRRERPAAVLSTLPDDRCWRR